MGRHAAVFTLRHWANGFWYYRLPGMQGYATTGIRGPGRPADRHQAECFVREKMKSVEIAGTPAARLTLREYSTDFFVWGKCPHCEKLLAEGRQISKRHVRNQRLWLTKYVLKDPIADRALGEISRADVLDFRARIKRKLATHLNTANKSLAVLKTICKEAFFREDLDRDPTAGVGNLKENRREPGIFTAGELQALFPAEGLGPWKSLLDKTCFLLAADSGMRRGEILALRWCNVDLDAALVHVLEAWKGGEEVGLPKWGRTRVAPLTDATVRALRELQEDSIRTHETDLVFCFLDGSRLGDTWWKKHFASAMEKVKIGEGENEKVGIDVRARGIKPHSFRHTAATLRRDAGEDPAKIRAALGWTNARTQEGYEHFTADMLRSSALEKLFP
jgi:integrase